MAPMLPPLRAPICAEVPAWSPVAPLASMAPAPAPANIEPARLPVVEPTVPVATAAVDQASAAVSPAVRSDSFRRPGIGRFGSRLRRGAPRPAVDLLPAGGQLARAEDLRQPFRRPMTVLVANPKGGAGKTPVALMLAGTLALLRGGHVLAWDNNEARGDLANRANPRGFARPGVDCGLTVRDLLDDLGAFESHAAGMGELAGYLRPQDELFDVLASDDAAGSLAQIGAEDFGRLHAVLSRYYRIVVLDSGNNVRSQAWQAAAAAADCLVLASSYEADSLAAADWTLEHLRAIGRGDLVEATVTVLTAASGRPDPAVAAEALARFQGTAASIEIPHDPALRGGAQIVRGDLGQATVAAVLEAARAVVEQLSALDARTESPVTDSVPAEFAAPIVVPPHAAAVNPIPLQVVGSPAGRAVPAPKVVAARVSAAKVPAAPTVSARTSQSPNLKPTTRQPAGEPGAVAKPATRKSPARKRAEPTLPAQKPTAPESAPPGPTTPRPRRAPQAATPLESVPAAPAETPAVAAVVAPRAAKAPKNTRRTAKPRTDAPVLDTPPVTVAPVTGAATSGEVDSIEIPLPGSRS